MNSRFATKGQVEYALKLGAIKEAADGERMTKKAISRLIESAKQNRYQDLCRTYDELDSDLQRSGDILSITEKATTLKKQGGSNWYCGPCPKCGGTDRFYINTKDNLFKCGHSSGGNGCGWGGGIAQMAAYVFRCSTWDAIDYLTGQSPRNEPVNTQILVRPLPSRSAKVEERPYVDFSSVCETSMRCLWTSSGQAGRNYLSMRGIKENTMLANRVGFYVDARWVNARQAVCFPHELMINGKMQVISLNRRFLDDDTPKTKHISNGRWGLYHLAGVYGAKILIVIEGEINGLSIWQEVRQMGLLADVISVGSEGAFKKLAEPIRLAAKNYESLVIWADEPKIAQQAIQFIKHPRAIAMHSKTGPKGLELDANKLLSLGLLPGLLSRLYAHKCIKAHKVSVSLAASKPPMSGLKDKDVAFDMRHSSETVPITPAPSELDDLLNEAGSLVERLNGQAYTEGEKLYLELEDAFVNDDIKAAQSVHARIKSLVTQQAWAVMGAAQRMENNALYL